MEEKFKAFLWKRIDQTMGDLRDAGSAEEVDRGIDALETFLEELKSLMSYGAPKQETTESGCI